MFDFLKLEFVAQGINFNCLSIWMDLFIEISKWLPEVINQTKKSIIFPQEIWQVFNVFHFPEEGTLILI